jgi:hypothetical protein
MGLIMLCTSVWMVYEAVDAWRNGGMIHVPHQPALEPWAALVMASLGAFFGICTVLVGLGILKTRDTGRPD